MQIEKGIISVRGHSVHSGFINQESVIVDLGSNLGEFSGQMSSKFGCKCYAVEALPSLYAKIPDNPLVQKFNYAISSSDAPITIYISENPEANTIKEVASQSWCNDGAIQVEDITFETFLKRHEISSVDVLKIDIEGAELELFKEISDEVLTEVKQIAVEFHDFIKEFDCAKEVQEIKDKLISLGFLCIIPLRGLNVDVLFINKNKCKLSEIDSLFLSLQYDFIPYGVRFFQHTISRFFNISKKAGMLLKVVTRSQS